MNKTGATRYQKFLKSEKAKTKLKAKKDLPKGTNVTKTNFKVKKIVIKEQLKKHGEAELLSTRKLNAKELLSRLNHFNTNSRTDALEGLRELITAYPETLEQNLGQIILGVTPLILNVEKVVRRDTLKVLHVILSNVHLEKIDPFFDIMSTYLRSAMTHIDNRIQEDSLQFLDVLLICTPGKIADNFHKIIPNFLDMISKLRIDAKPGRTLTVNLNSQITSVKWRIKVIHRLQEFLHKYAEYNHLDDTTNQTEVNTKVFDPHRSNHFPLFNIQNISVSNILNAKNIQSIQDADEGEKFQAYVDTLMPLLFETWLEVCPNTKSDKNIETVISEDAAILLRHVLKVMSLLFKLVKNLDNLNPSSNMKTSFLQKYKNSFSQHFINAFPYVTNVRSKQAKSVDSANEDVIKDPKMIAENLEICHLYIVLNPNVNVKKHIEEITSVLAYIEKTFNGNCNENICDNVLNILYTLFSNEATGWSRTLTILDTLFKKIIQIYFNESTPDALKQKVFALLCKIALNENLSHFHSSDVYGVWLQNLPDILLNKSVTVQTVNIIHKFATTNNKIFNSVVKPKLKTIIENLPNIIISDCVSDINSYHKLFSLFYWIKAWDTDSLNLLETQLMNNVYKNDYGKYIFDTLRLKGGGIL
ncbi:testis-expressed protein 10 [Epargyreus clarus]|uniref:testis-expressed protein 10 n=1 Tax=Epargyreus clarus TaxID=520877 RepID=UPI003C2F10B3